MLEQQLVHAWVRNRDVKAFRSLCEAHAGMVLATSQRVLRNRADAEEITQECFLRLARASGEFRGSLGAWLHRVALNLCLDRVRSETARRAREERYSRELPGSHASAWDDLREHIDAAIDALPDELRETLVAHYLEGRTHQEIAEEAGVTRSAITQRIHRALSQVREELARRGLIIAVVALGALLEENASSASVQVPAALLERVAKAPLYAATTSPAFSVAGGVLTWKVAALLSAALVLGGLFWWRQSAATSPEANAGVSISISPSVSPAAPSAASRESSTPPIPVIASASAPGKEAVEATLEGFVFESQTHRPLEGVGLVCAVDDGSASFSYDSDDVARTDSEGRYRIVGLAPGAYKVLCIQRWERRDGAGGPPYPVELQFKGNRDTQRIEVGNAPMMTLPPFEVILGETVSGRVVGPDNVPVAGAYVLMRAMKSSVYIDVTTRADGTFKAGGFPLSDQFYVHATDGRASSLLKEENGRQERIPPDDVVRISGPVGPLSIVKGGLQGIEVVVRPGASVAGVLLDDQGRAQVGVPVMARSRAPEYLDSRFEITGEKGEFLLAGLAPGTYDIAWNRPGPQASESPSWSPSEAEVLQEIAIQGVEKRTGLLLRAAAPPDSGLSIAGRVLNTRGAAVEGAQVATIEAGEGHKAKTEADGRFRIDGLVEQSYYLSVTHPDYSTAMEDMEAISAGASDVEIQLEDLGIVEGHVLDAETRRPVAEFQLRVQSGKGETRRFQVGDGAFRVDRVCAGKNAVIAVSEGYTESRAEVEVIPGETLGGIELLLTRGLSLRGVVVDAEGEPVAGARIYRDRVPQMPEERETLAVARSAEDGRFQLDNLAGASGSVGAWMPGYAEGLAYYEDGENDIRIMLRNDLGSVIGKVLLGGEGVEGAKVTILGKRLIDISGLERSTRTDATGEFRIGDIPAGDYRISTWLKANPENPLQAKNLTQEISIADDTEAQVLLAIPEGDAGIYGTLQIQHAPPAAGFASLQVDTEAGRQDYMAQLDELGAFQLDSITPGSVRLHAALTVSPGRVISHRAEFKLAQGQHLDVSTDLDMLVEVAGVLRGLPPGRFASVVLVPGQISPDTASLSDLIEQTQGAVSQTSLKDDPSFELSATASGDYTLIAWTSVPPKRVDGIAALLLKIEGGTPVPALELTLNAP